MSVRSTGWRRIKADAAAARSAVGFPTRRVRRATTARRRRDAPREDRDGEERRLVQEESPSAAGAPLPDVLREDGVVSSGYLVVSEAWGADAPVSRLVIDYERPLFTFDDGPSEWTVEILDLLAEYDARSSFFVTGLNVLGREEILRLVSSAGHIVGPHGFSHRRLTELDEDGVDREIVSTLNLIRSVTGLKAKYWRAPFFAVDEMVLRVAAKHGLTYVPANLIPEDWMATDPEELAAKILDGIVPGSVVSLHDGIPPDGGSSSCTDSRQVTVDALRIVLEQLAVAA